MSALLKYAVAAALIGGAGCDDAVGPDEPPKTLETALQEVLDASVGTLRPGVYLQIQGDGLDLNLTSGFVEEGGAAWGSEHVFHAASVGKSWVGLSLAILANRGELSLSDPITQWLPSNLTQGIPTADQITISDLLHHTSGIVDVLNEMTEAISAFANAPGPWTNGDFASFALGRPLNFEPGSAFRYSNTNYMLAGMILEQVSGTPYDVALQSLVFDPLGMTRTTTATRAPLTGPPVHGYMVSDGELIDATEFALLWAPASGGQWTTTDDLTRFIRGVFEGDAISDDVRALITEGSAWAPYGLGMGTAELGYGTMHGHDGLFLGYATHVSYFPDSGISIVLAANGVGGAGLVDDATLFNDVLKEVFER